LGGATRSCEFRLIAAFVRVALELPRNLGNRAAAATV
jgi:hypothetical protein